MALTDHIAILTHSALATAVPNRKKPQAPLQFFAVVAFPPTAAEDLKAVLMKAAPGGSLNGISVRVPRNSQTAKPIPGIPDDWFVIRAASQFPPYVADETGAQLDQSSQGNAIRQQFFAGKRVRAAFSAYFWPNEGGGLSFNLDGIMAVTDGDRLAIGNQAASQFAAYAVAPALAAGTANPFGGSAQAVQTATQTSADPFHQAAKPTGANPFA
jgi:hypothetical protein